MTIPIYSNLKAKLEAKGLDIITSGQIAWFFSAAIYSFIPAISFSTYFCVVNQSVYMVVFSITLLLCFLFCWFILLCFHKRFLFINVTYIVLFIFCYHYGFVLFIILALWLLSFMIFKLPFSFRVLQGFVYACFTLFGIIFVMLWNNIFWRFYV